MSSVIGMICEGGTIKYIFVHDPCNVGKVLDESYRCPKKVEELIEHGDIEKLEDKIKGYSFKNYKCYSNGGERFLNNGSYSTYLFKNGTWYVKCLNSRSSHLLSEPKGDF